MYMLYKKVIRFGHTLIQGTVDLVSKDGLVKSQYLLRHNYFNTTLYLQDDGEKERHRLKENSCGNLSNFPSLQNLWTLFVLFLAFFSILNVYLWTLTFSSLVSYLTMYVYPQMVEMMKGLTVQASQSFDQEIKPWKRKKKQTLNFLSYCIIYPLSWQK